MTDTPASYSGPQRIFSGIQPTGNLHLGNYLGALKKFVDLQEEGWDAVYAVVDLHAITMPVEKGALVSQTRLIAAAFLACGVDPKKSILYAQSSVKAHVELAWIFNCVARMGWVERMTQFKDKAGKDAERASVGLFTYPVLQAADILAYKATHVPVGEDQKQHLELSRDIADRFNREYDAPGFFPLPEPLIKGPGARVMSLKDGTKKMSKSDPKGRPEVENLVGIYAALAGESVEAVLKQYGGQGFGVFKPALAEVTVNHLAPITQRYREILDDTGFIDSVLKDGAERADAISAPIIDDVRKLVGFWGA